MIIPPTIKQNGSVGRKKWCGIEPSWEKTCERAGRRIARDHPTADVPPITQPDRSAQI
jgi:hypothetical protein